MVVSHARESDRIIRKNILEIMQMCVRMGKIDDAKKFGIESARLKAKIESYDYSKEDRIQMALVANDKKWEALHKREVMHRDDVKQATSKMAGGILEVLKEDDRIEKANEALQELIEGKAL